MRVRKSVAVGFAVVAAAAALLGNTKCGAGLNGGGIAVSGAGGGDAVAVPWARTGGVWVGTRGGYGWLAAGTGAAAGGLALANWLGRGRNAAGGTSTVPYANTDICKGESRQYRVLEKWIWSTGVGHNVSRIRLDCLGFLNALKGKPGGKGEKVLECITWILTRGAPISNGTHFGFEDWRYTWRWAGAKVEINSNGRITDVSPGKMGWNKCANGGAA